MTTSSRDEAARGLQIGDVLALLAGIAIVIAYFVLPLRADFTNPGNTGLSFIDSTTTFPALTLVIGVAAIVGAFVNITSLRDSSVRWYYVGLGLLGLIFVIDNSLRGRRELAIGGIVATLGAVLLVIQGFLPRARTSGEDRSKDIVLGVVRILIGTLWFTQLLWKLPPSFGCPPGSFVPAANTSGLCDWIGREIAQPRYGIYKDFLVNIVSPNLSWMGWIIWATEAFIAISLIFGLFTRLGGFTALAMGINLFIGLTAIPIEWDWTYLMLPAFGAVFLGVGGRFVGLDDILHRWLSSLAAGGNRLFRLLAWLTS